MDELVLYNQQVLLAELLCNLMNELIRNLVIAISPILGTG